MRRWAEHAMHEFQRTERADERQADVSFGSETAPFLQPNLGP